MKKGTRNEKYCCLFCLYCLHLPVAQNGKIYFQLLLSASTDSGQLLYQLNCPINVSIRHMRNHFHSTCSLCRRWFSFRDSQFRIYTGARQEQRLSYDVRVQFSDYSKDYLWLCFFSFLFLFHICTQSEYRWPSQIRNNSSARSAQTKKWRKIVCLARSVR